VDGAPVPRGYDEADGSKRENGVEVVLPRARASARQRGVPRLPRRTLSST
jgi:hypothetical protein